MPTPAAAMDAAAVLQDAGTVLDAADAGPGEDAAAIVPNDVHMRVAFRVLCRFDSHEMSTWAEATGSSEESPFSYLARTRVDSDSQSESLDVEVAYAPLQQPRVDAMSHLSTPSGGYVHYEGSARAEATPAIVSPAFLGGDEVTLGPSLVLGVSDIRTCGNGGWDTAQCWLSGTWSGLEWMNVVFIDPEGECFYRYG